MFKYRAISFPILIALLAVMIFWPEWGRYLFVVVASLAAAMMFREIGAMLRNIGVAVFEKSTVLFGGLFLFSMLSLSVARQTGSRAMTILFFLLLMFCMLAVIYAGWLLLLFGKEKKENFDPDASFRRHFPSGGNSGLCAFNGLFRGIGRAGCSVLCYDGDQIDGYRRIYLRNALRQIPAWRQS